MKFYSLNRQTSALDFRDATIAGLAPDNGLYFPTCIPDLRTDFCKDLSSLSRQELAYHIIAPFVGDTIPGSVLERIIAETLAFDFPLVSITENIFSLELFHGPTMSFKDVGARFMSRCLGYFSSDGKSKMIVVVATSGDTGSAVADGFFQVDGVDVVILYPSGKVSPMQESQLTAYGGNIHALRIEGNFDDCQRLVKKAFTDKTLSSLLTLSSANSINIARWLPQQFYYFFALQQWKNDSPPVISVPSGNFGNICAGLLAKRRGLPVKKFIAACNANDTISRWYDEGLYSPEATKATISNAMDVSDPSNFPRILELFNHDNNKLKSAMLSMNFSDKETTEAILELYEKFHYTADPHGAVGYLGLKNYQIQHPQDAGLFLETAAPVKFRETVEPLTGEPLQISTSLLKLQTAKKHLTDMPNTYEPFAEYLRSI